MLVTISTNWFNSYFNGVHVTQPGLEPKVFLLLKFKLFCWFSTILAISLEKSDNFVFNYKNITKEVRNVKSVNRNTSITDFRKCVVMNEERTGLCLRQMENTRCH